MTNAKQLALKIEGISKSFGPTRANNHIDMELYKGEIHGFAGENGSGKSTLASIICGVQQPDSGAMFKNGERYAPMSPIEANGQRVAMVVQELGIISTLPVVMNIFMGHMDQFKKAGLINHGKMRAAAHALLDKWDLGPIPLNRMTGELSIEQRKLIELARALATDPDILVLDEITQALSHDLREKLYKLMHTLTSMGKTILLITHDMEEMIELADTITVLRDGKVVGTEARADIDLDKLRRMMIGRTLDTGYYRTDEAENHTDEVVLKVRGLGTHVLKNVDFDLHRGEIMAVCGLSDAGIHDLGKALYGVAEHRVGTVVHAPSGKVLKSPVQMLKSKGAYLSKDRDDDGLMLYASIKENIFVPSARELSGVMGFINPRKITKLAKDAFKKFEIKATGIDQSVRRLSGGNKQKVNLSRWLVKDLEYIVLDCPTRGVDVGVKAYIYGLMQELKAQGLAILMISDELPEAMGMADHIMVMKDGQIQKIIGRSSHFTEEAIIEVMI